MTLLLLGSTITRRRLLDGWWRWVPLGVILAQFPIFVLAGAIGDGLGREALTDGLGLMLTGAAWILLAWALTRRAGARPSPLPR